MTNGALVVVALDAIATVIWHSMRQVLPVEGDAEVAVGEAWPVPVR